MSRTSHTPMPTQEDRSRSISPRKRPSSELLCSGSYSKDELFMMMLPLAWALATMPQHQMSARDHRVLLNTFFRDLINILTMPERVFARVDQFPSLLSFSNNGMSLLSIPKSIEPPHEKKAHLAVKDQEVKPEKSRNGENTGENLDSSRETSFS